MTRVHDDKNDSPANCPLLRDQIKLAINLFFFFSYFLINKFVLIVIKYCKGLQGLSHIYFAILFVITYL